MIALALLVASCGAGAEPAPPPGAVRADASTAMAAVSSASFSIVRAGAPITISGLEFTSATGVYAAPDRARAVLEVKAGDVTARLGTIAVGEQVWLTDPVTGRWNALDPGTGFNPAVVFDPDVGWSAILGTDMTDAETAPHDGELVRLAGTVAADRVAVLTAGLAEPQPTEIEMLIERETWRLARVAFETSGPNGVSSWTIELSDYDQAADVEPPDA